MAAGIKICSVAAVVVAACACLTAGYPFVSPSPSSYVENYDHQPPQEAYTFQQHGESDSDAASSEPRTYHFQYAVNDPTTGDVKSQNEVGDGHGGVRGTYSLVEPDGSTRVVEYAADAVHGFTAEVKRIAPQHKAAAVEVTKTAEYGIEQPAVPVHVYTPEVSRVEPQHNGIGGGAETAEVEIAQSVELPYGDDAQYALDDGSDAGGKYSELQYSHR